MRFSAVPLSVISLLRKRDTPHTAFAAFTAFAVFTPLLTVSLPYYRTRIPRVHPVHSQHRLRGLRVHRRTALRKDAPAMVLGRILISREPI